VLALPGGTSVLLFGPRGISRSVGGGQFDAVPGKLVGRAVVTDAQLAGTAIFAWASGGRQVLASANQGRTWSAMTLPMKKTRVRQLSFVARSTGFVLDTAGRVWRTRNDGCSWRQSLSAGTSDVSGITFGSATSGYLSFGGFGGDATTAYVLHTSDAGRSWRPQAISTGHIGASGIVAPDASHAFALVQPGEASRRLFFTQTGGDAGAASPVSNTARPAWFTSRSLRAARGARQGDARRGDRRRASHGLDPSGERLGLDDPDRHRGCQRRLVFGDVHGEEEHGRVRRPMGR
jgi:hypothetical protein